MACLGEGRFDDGSGGGAGANMDDGETADSKTSKKRKVGGNKKAKSARQRLAMADGD